MRFAVWIEKAGDSIYIHTPVQRVDEVDQRLLGTSPYNFLWTNNNDDIGWFDIDRARDYQLRLPHEEARIISEPEYLIRQVLES